MIGGFHVRGDARFLEIVYREDFYAFKVNLLESRMRYRLNNKEMTRVCLKFYKLKTFGQKTRGTIFGTCKVESFADISITGSTIQRKEKRYFLTCSKNVTKQH